MITQFSYRALFSNRGWVTNIIIHFDIDLNDGIQFLFYLQFVMLFIAFDSKQKTRQKVNPSCMDLFVKFLLSSNNYSKRNPTWILKVSKFNWQFSIFVGKKQNIQVYFSNTTKSMTTWSLGLNHEFEYFKCFFFSDNLFLNRSTILLSAKSVCMFHLVDFWFWWEN